MIRNATSSHDFPPFTTKAIMRCRLFCQYWEMSNMCSSVNTRIVFKKRDWLLKWVIVNSTSTGPTNILGPTKKCHCPEEHHGGVHLSHHYQCTRTTSLLGHWTWRGGQGERAEQPQQLFKHWVSSTAWSLQGSEKLLHPPFCCLPMDAGTCTRVVLCQLPR